ncbi:HTH-type transcriptional repressor OpcR [Poriferisphaera corsica]|uniref:HTH-type transcriptional regulator n=1 Tax=Poriferisphaera corsica TaxID=2528020 RepID=A0A517YX48_9BACT|nr:ArsR family transcriptional regulator [Poriferisphaera corsica]QDU34800.1 HTH-type transcriptional repressor OpcR [Poriferisphaera corsica]
MMNQNEQHEADGVLNESREHFIQGMCTIAQFWGFPKAMGAVYGVVYLSDRPVGLNQLVELSGVTKGAVSTHVRALDRLGLVHKKIVVGDRRDFYTAETDFWKIVRNVLKEREKPEFDQALRTVGESRAMLKDMDGCEGECRERQAFCDERMKNMEEFFKMLDKLVATIVALDDLQQSTVGKVMGLFKGSID